MHVDPFISELKTFHCSDRYRELITAYWGKPGSAFQGIEPLWDTSLEAQKLNWEVFEEDRHNLELIEIEMFQIIRKIQRPHDYTYPGVYREAHRDQFIRVIDRWLARIALPPPVMRVGYSGLFRKMDGFHRLAVAGLADVPSIPCWVMHERAI